jgi:LysM repeat protein
MITPLLVAALVLPLLGALLLRLLMRVLPSRGVGAVAILLAIAIVSIVLSLASVNISSLRIANFTLLLPVASSVNRQSDVNLEAESELLENAGTPTPYPEVTITPVPTFTPTVVITATDVITDSTIVTDSTVLTDTGVITDSTVITDTGVITDTSEEAQATAEPTPEPTSAPVASQPTATLVPSPEEPTNVTVYYVKPGDTLGAIAERFNVTVAEIEEVNPYLQNPDNLLVGQELNIP